MARNKWMFLGATIFVAVIVTGVVWYRAGRQPGDDPTSRGDQPNPSKNPSGVEGPASFAPAPISLADATRSFYSGDQAVQKDLKEGILEVKRTAVLRGAVHDREGKALDGVKLLVAHHPEFGHAVSRPDGSFDMVVNGGGHVCVHYQKDGYLPACRQVDVPWQDYAWLPDVSLVQVDPKMTAVDLSADAAFQVVQGSGVKDKDGARRATLLIPRGTDAQMFQPGGKTKPLSSLHVRLTEYTVGERGLAAMPAPLPPTSAYTYALEITADEVAENGGIKVGGKDVLLSKPAWLCVDNFLKIPVGAPVPMGYFDNDKGAWTASESGRVIQVVRVTGETADLDVEGSGKVADAAALTKIDMTDAERKELAQLYKPGQSLWRVPIFHFSNGDLNYAPKGAAGSDTQGPEGDENGDQCDTRIKSMSVIEVQRQALTESLGLAGTGLYLHYRSDHVPGRTAARTTKIFLSGDKTPDALQRIDLQVQVAGQLFKKSFPPEANQTYSYVWDGKDSFGRLVAGKQRLTARVGYVYNPTYERTDRFGAPGNGQLLQGANGRMEIVFWRTFELVTGAWDARLEGLGGWTLSAYHAYDPVARELIHGDGQPTKGRGTSLNQDLAIIVGNGPGNAAYVGDGGQAAAAGVFSPCGLAAAPDGSLYIADCWNHAVRRVAPNGIISTVAGTGRAGFGGDGGAATKAQLFCPCSLAIDSDGSLYIADSGNFLIRRVTPDGVMVTFAGTPPVPWTNRPQGAVQGGFAGDGGPAAKARFADPCGIALSPDGSLYIVDRGNHRVRQVGPDGIIQTIAGTGNAEFSGDGGPAVKANLSNPGGVAVGPDGAVYVYDGCLSYHRVRKIGIDGLIMTIAGGGKEAKLGDGGPATDARLETIREGISGGTFRKANFFGRALAVGRDGAVYVAGENGRVRRVGAEGIITTVAGGGDKESPDAKQPTQAKLSDLRGIAISPDGGFFISEGGEHHRVLRVSAGLPGLGANEIVLVSNDGRELYRFSPEGRHLETRSASTGALQLRFGHDNAGRLTQVEDAYGNKMAIERNALGAPIATVAPGGQRTELALNADGYLQRVTRPGNENVELTYAPGGLLASLKNARGAESHFAYDAVGRLTRDEGPGGELAALERSELPNGFAVSHTTALKPPSVYKTEHLLTGEENRLNQCCCGAETNVHVSADGKETVTFPNGTVSTQEQQPDPRWGMGAPLLKSMSLTTPGGRTAQVSVERTAKLTEPTNPLSLQTLTDKVTINGRTYTQTTDVGKRQYTRVTPAGRESIVTTDEHDQVRKIQLPGRVPTEYDYDAQVRVVTIRQGAGEEARVVALEYDDRGRLKALVDALKRKATAEYNESDRVVKQTLPGGRDVAFAYYSSGDLKSLTPPGRPAHGFEYTSSGLLKDYQPPAAGAGRRETSYEYNKDRQPTRVVLPDEKTVELGYDKFGHLETVAYPGGVLRYTFDAKKEHLTSINAPDGTLSFAYDGSLPTEQVYDGAIKGRVTKTYDNDFRVKTVTVNDLPPAAREYDSDGLLTRVGDFSVERDPKSGMIKGTRYRTIATTQEYNPFGERKRFSAATIGKEVFVVQYERDRLGRIAKLTETLDGKQTAFDYDYDEAGRLQVVRKDGVRTARYEYDANGNRVKFEGPNGAVTGQYDDQDRILQYGDAKYQHTANGQWARKTVNGKNTDYGYDALGNLRSVSLPDGTKIEYVVDGANRRIGKKVNGKLVQAFLYQSQLKPIAELDGDNRIVSRFVYGTKVNVPEYLEKGGKTYRIVTDHLGSPRMVVNVDTSEIVQRMDFDDFGNVLKDTNPGFQPFGFAGGIYDQSTGLTRFGARDYDASIGRWTAKDPVGFAGSENLYSYVGQDPQSSLDPSGRWGPVGWATGGGVHGRYGDPGGREGNDCGPEVGGSRKKSAKKQDPKPKATPSPSSTPTPAVTPKPIVPSPFTDNGPQIRGETPWESEHRGQHTEPTEDHEHYHHDEHIEEGGSQFLDNPVFDPMPPIEID